MASVQVTKMSGEERCGMNDTRCGMRDTGYEMRETRCGVANLNTTIIYHLLQVLFACFLEQIFFFRGKGVMKRSLKSRTRKIVCMQTQEQCWPNFAKRSSYGAYKPILQDRSWMIARILRSSAAIWTTHLIPTLISPFAATCRMLFWKKVLELAAPIHHFRPHYGSIIYSLMITFISASSPGLLNICQTISWSWRMLN